MSDTQSKDSNKKGPMHKVNLGPNINVSIFEQILELDDTIDEREFSRSIVFDFFEQAEQTFEEMDIALKDRDLEKLSSLSYFLMGSSAMLGLTRVRKSCEMIVQYGQQEDAAGEVNKLGEQACTDAIDTLLNEIKEMYAEDEALLKRFFA